MVLAEVFLASPEVIFALIDIGLQAKRVVAQRRRRMAGPVVQRLRLALAVIIDCVLVVLQSQYALAGRLLRKEQAREQSAGGLNMDRWWYVWKRLRHPLRAKLRSRLVQHRMPRLDYLGAGVGG